MIAVLRIRFDTNNDSATVWSDELFDNWMHPAIPFSLGNYWWESAWGFFDLQYQLFPAFVTPDPRASVVILPTDTQAMINDKLRGALVNGAIQQATMLFAPAWDQFDIVFVWYAQKTDTFGGGEFAVPLQNGGTKMIPSTVVDVKTQFSGVCLELGHGFGLNHEVDAGGNDYRGPYSSMSDMEFSRFTRPGDPRLPDGDVSDDRVPAQLRIGPTLPAAQLYRFPWFKGPPRVVKVPANYATVPQMIKVYSLDHARALSQSAALPVLAIIPAAQPGGREYAIELRRGGQRYDQAIGSPTGPAAGLVVHSYNPDGRVRYDGVLPINGPNGDLDWTSAAGNFTLRLVDLDPANEWAQFQIGAGNFTSRRSVDITEASQSVVDAVFDVKSVTFDEGCVKGTFKYELRRRTYDFTFFATSYGFNPPVYKWTLDDVPLLDDPASTPPGQLRSATIHPQVTIPAPAVGSTASGGTTKATTVTVQYQLVGNRLHLTTGPGVGNYTCTLRVVAAADTTLSLFSVSAERYIYVHGMRFEWEQAYRDKVKSCYAWVSDIFRIRRPLIEIDLGDPPPFHARPDEMEELLQYEHALHDLNRLQPERAQALIDYMVLQFNVPRQAIISRMERQNSSSQEQ